MLTFDTVKKLGLALPDVVSGTAYGSPALKLGGRLLACVPANKSAEANSLVVRLDLERLAGVPPDAHGAGGHDAKNPHAHWFLKLDRQLANCPISEDFDLDSWLRDLSSPIADFPCS